MKDPRSLLLALLSVSLVITWVFHLYDKNKYASNTSQVNTLDSTTLAEAVNDSLQKLFTITLYKLSTENITIDSSHFALKNELGEQVNELNNLKNEISNILKRKNISQKDLDEAKTKIRELQTRIGGLQSENESLAEEKIKMNNLVEQLNYEMVAVQLNMSKVSNENKQLTQTIYEASTFIANELTISAVTVKGGTDESITTVSKRAEKFIVSFSVRNNISNYPNAEVVIIITEPTGKTLTADVWDSGSFETKSEGRKRFTRKVRFEYTKRESKKIIFSIEPELFEKGIYKFSLYHNGYRIGETNCRLS